MVEPETNKTGALTSVAATAPRPRGPARAARPVAEAAAPAEAGDAAEATAEPRRGGTSGAGRGLAR